MDLNDANLIKSLECPVCLDFFDEPKLLTCGHTVCQKCVNKVAKTRRTPPNAWSAGVEQKYLKCPECGKETKIPLGGLTTNYRLVDLVCRAKTPPVDVYACNGCGKQAPVADMFTCETCQEALAIKPLWLCAVCAMKQHRGHAMSECNKATRQQIQEACKGIARSCSLAGMYIGLTMSRLNGPLETTVLISQLLNEQKSGFLRLEERIKSGDDHLAQEDLAASVQAATDLKQKFVQASSFASEASKDLENVLQAYRKKLEELFPKEQEEELIEAEDSDMSDEEESMETEDSGLSRNNFDLSKFNDNQEAIELNQCRVDAIPDLSRFTKLELLGFRNNLLTSIIGNFVHTTLTELDLYENQIAEISGLDALVNLEILDISYNRLRKIQGLTKLVKLKRICLLHNKIDKIEGLDTLVNLELLELGDNRIKAIENLANQHNLRELYLGKNKIRKIENIAHLSQLRVLNLPGNRITKLQNLDTLVDLEELHVAEQGIQSFAGIQKLNKLKLIDAAKNSIASLHHLDHLQQLEDLWLNDNKISLWSEVDKLAKLASLETVYLEGNAIQTQDPNNYRRKVILALQQVAQVDATPCR
ncbi:leucine Rich Repeat family protein [Aphelenchoides avenae]|nr:leucine Rich Repeat family protein [Aphelenchus avenae]